MVRGVADLFEVGVNARDTAVIIDGEIEAADFVAKVAGEVDPGAGAAVIQRRYRQEAADRVIADEKPIDIVADTTPTIELLAS